MKKILALPKKIWSLPKKFLIPGIIALILIGFFIFKPQNRPVQQFASAKKTDIRSEVSSSGSLTGKNVANLRFASSGKLAYLNVKAGDEVSAGQVIAGLDTQDLAIKLQQAQNTYRDKQATVDKILDDIHQFQYGNGGFGNVGTSNETETQRQARTTAEAARDSALDSVKAAQRAFSDNVIVSPISGLVTVASFVPGQVVSGGDTIATVVDTSEVFFDSDIDEADIGKISIGEKAEVNLDAFPTTPFEGSVNQVLPQTKTTSSGATVVTVKVELAGPSNFVQGLSGQVSIITQEAKAVIIIPQEALRDDNTVIVQQGSNLRVQKVVPGIYSDTDVEIKEGLKVGDRVLLNPPAPGARLTGQNRNPLQTILFRIVGGGRGGGGGGGSFAGRGQ